MDDTKISALPAASALTGVETFPVVQSGATKKATISQVTTAQLVTESGTSRTLGSSDNGKIILCTSNSAVTITCPDGLVNGFNATFVQMGTGKVTLSAGGTATLVSYGSLLSTIGQYAVISVVNSGSNTFVAAGNLGV